MNKKKLSEYIEMVFDKQVDFCVKQDLTYGAIDFAVFAQIITNDERLELFKNIEINCCKDFIKTLFDEISFKNGGIEVNFFWEKAKEYGLCFCRRYGMPMSEALSEMAKVETIFDENGKFCMDVFCLK